MKSALLCSAIWPNLSPTSCAVSCAQTAKELGIEVVGVSFHVGSGAIDPKAFGAAIALARAAFDAGAGERACTYLMLLGCTSPWVCFARRSRARGHCCILLFVLACDCEERVWCLGKHLVRPCSHHWWCCGGPVHRMARGKCGWCWRVESRCMQHVGSALPEWLCTWR